MSLSAYAFVFLLRPRTLPWSFLLCSRAAIATMRVLKLMLRQLALQLLSAEGLDKKKELNKVVLRQSMMNWVGAALDDLGRDLPMRA